MAGTLAKAVRRADAVTRLSTLLDVQQADLKQSGRDPELALIMTLERVADAVEQLTGKTAPSKRKAAAKEPSKTIETVKEKPMETTETVEVVEAAKPKRGGKDAN